MVHANTRSRLIWGHSMAWQESHEPRQSRPAMPNRSDYYFLRHSVSGSLIKSQWNPEARVDVLSLSFSLFFSPSFFSPYVPQSLVLYWYLVLKKNLPFVRPFSFKSKGFPRTLRIIPSNHSLILLRNKGRGDSAFAKWATLRYDITL